MVLLRGESIISITAEAPPPPSSRKPGEGMIVNRAVETQRKLTANLPVPTQAPPGVSGLSSIRAPPPPSSMAPVPNES